MKFYRKAFKGDFERFEESCTLPFEIKNMLRETERLIDASKEYSRLRGVTLSYAKEECQSYLNYLHAKRDFFRKKDVYVDY